MIKNILLEISGKEIEIMPEEARELYQILGEYLGKDIQCIPSFCELATLMACCPELLGEDIQYIPYSYPVPSYPYWSIVPPTQITLQTSGDCSIPTVFDMTTRESSVNEI